MGIHRPCQVGRDGELFEVCARIPIKHRTSVEHLIFGCIGCIGFCCYAVVVLPELPLNHKS